MQQARICIVTPLPLGSNPRVVKEATALCEAGCAVTVIATRILAHVDARDEAVLAAAEWRAERLDFRRRGVAWRLRRMRQITAAHLFAMTGWGGFADRGVAASARELHDAARQNPADLYIAHYPVALPAVAGAARRHGAAYAYDAEDFHLGDWPETPERQRVRGIVRAVEARYLPGCAYVTAAAPGIADGYAAAYGIRRPEVVLNVFPLRQAPPRLPGDRTEASVYWFSQTIGPNRGLECAVKAIGCARTRPHLYLRGNPDPIFLARLRDLAAAVGAADRLHILPPAAPAAMERLAAAYDVGFSGEPGHTENNRRALGNKLFSYLLAGLPIVMSDVPAHRRFSCDIRGAARLFAADDPDDLADTLDGLLGVPAALAAARVAAFEWGRRRFNWDVEKHALIRCVRAALAAPRTQIFTDAVAPPGTA